MRQHGQQTKIIVAVSAGNVQKATYYKNIRLLNTIH